MFALYDSGASITQVSPKAIEPLLPYLEELDTDKVQFVSAENRSLRKMRLFGCESTSLVQVESGVRSEPRYTLVVENPMPKSFPVLFGLRSMCDLGLITDHGQGIVRDPEGRPFRLYSQGAKPAVQPSLAILSRKWKDAVQRKIPRRPAPPTPGRYTAQWQTVRRGTAAPSRARQVMKESKSPRQDQPLGIRIPEDQQSISSSQEGVSLAPANPSESSRSLPGSIDGVETSTSIPGSSEDNQESRPRPGSEAASGTSKDPSSRSPTRSQWPREELFKAEASNDRQGFQRLVTRHIHPLQRFLLRHAEHTGRTFPNLSSFIQAEGERDPGFKHRWNDLWQQHARWIHKPSRRKLSYSVRSSPATSEVKRGPEPEAEEPSALPRRDKGSNGPPVPRFPARKRWNMDPTPPHLTTPFPKVGDDFSEDPVHLQPDFYESLDRKARDRWSRSFSM